MEKNIYEEYEHKIRKIVNMLISHMTYGYVFDIEATVDMFMNNPNLTRRRLSDNELTNISIPKIRVVNLSEFFEEAFFETKKVVLLGF